MYHPLLVAAHFTESLSYQLILSLSGVSSHADCRSNMVSTAAERRSRCVYRLMGQTCMRWDFNMSKYINRQSKVTFRSCRCPEVTLSYFPPENPHLSYESATIHTKRIHKTKKDITPWMFKKMCIQEWLKMWWRQPWIRDTEHKIKTKYLNTLLKHRLRCTNLKIWGNINIQF